MSDESADSTPKILLCVCTYERYELLGNALASLAAQTLPVEDYEIMVVDNSPDHDRAEAFGNGLSMFPNLTYVIEETEGLANARNVAARLAVAPLIAYLDDDAVAARDWAKEIVGAFEAFGPDCSMVAGAVDPIWGAPRPRWLHQDMLMSLSIIDWEGDAPRPARPEEVLVGANMAFRVEAIRRHGGFDTTLGRKGDGSVLISNEEAALEAKIRAAGERVVYAPRARVGHVIPESRLQRSWFRRRTAWQAVSDFQSRQAWCAEELRRDWPRVGRYFNQVPPLYRTLRGLFFDADQADLFREQLRVIYLTTLASLSGFAGLEGG
jgi:GT2 family glycosyltransferase